jgi:F-type H+-transporting ATPase subunit epsilon
MNLQRPYYGHAETRNRHARSQDLFGDVDMVTLPGVEGEMGIFPMHIALMTQVAAGEIIARVVGRTSILAVGEGFAEITGERVAILTDMAIKADDIDEVKAEEARKRAEARLQEKLSDEEQATVQAALVHSLTQLNVKRRRRG